MSMGGRWLWATEQVEEGHREAHVRVDSEERRFSPIHMRRARQPPSTDRMREQKRPLHWYVICLGLREDPIRWIQLVLWSGE